MTPAVRLANVDWAAMPERDAVAAERRAAGGAVDYSGGYRQAACVQVVYYAPGTVSEAQRLREVLGGIGEPLPTALRVAQTLRRTEASDLYDFEATGATWHLRNRSARPSAQPFAGDWRVVFEAGDARPSITVPGERLLGTLGLLEQLAGERSVEEVFAWVNDTEDTAAAELLRCLAGAGLLESAPASELDVASLPELLFLGHASIAVRDGEDLVVFDPVMLSSNVGLGAQRRPLLPLLRAAKAIVISHHHWDHLHFQTLMRLPRDVQLLVPRCTEESVMNPSIARYLRSLGFSRVRECSPGDRVAVGGVQLRFARFHGEPFGIDSAFDGLTYWAEFSGLRLFGTVDAWRDERGDMEQTIAEVADWGELDFFVFGASGQCHDPPYAAAGLRHYSNELRTRPDLLRYHPDVHDVERWARVLRPRYLLPYAEFIFGGAQREDLELGRLAESAPRTIDDVRSCCHRAEHLRWCDELRALAGRVSLPVVNLHPMQGIRRGEVR